MPRIQDVFSESFAPAFTLRFPSSSNIFKSSNNFSRKKPDFQTSKRVARLYDLITSGTYRENADMPANTEFADQQFTTRCRFCNHSFDTYKYGSCSDHVLYDSPAFRAPREEGDLAKHPRSDLLRRTDSRRLFTAVTRATTRCSGVEGRELEHGDE